MTETAETATPVEPSVRRDFHPQGHPDLERGHDTSRVSLKGILIVVGIFLFTAVVLHLGLWGLLHAYAAHPAFRDSPAVHRAETPLAALNPQIPGTPRLQAAPEDELYALKAQERKWLTSYGWQDRATGRVRIPIHRAKALLLQRGLPHPSSTQAVSTGEPNAQR